MRQGKAMAVHRDRSAASCTWHLSDHQSHEQLRAHLAAFAASHLSALQASGAQTNNQVLLDEEVHASTGAMTSRPAAMIIPQSTTHAL